jgi:hypothetical protein
MPVRLPDKRSTVYARHVGGYKELWCPSCMTFIRHKLTPDPESGIIIRCKHCHAVYLWATTLYSVSKAYAPPDCYSALFAEVYPDRIRKGQPVNRLRKLNPDGTWEEC